jgi:hypothetical protein
MNYTGQILIFINISISINIVVATDNLRDPRTHLHATVQNVRDAGGGDAPAA